LRQALRLYRQGQHSGATGTSTDLPPPGVYRYKTSGGEQLSFGGINRTFPTATDMIVDDGRCAAMKWEPLEQHTEGMVECRTEEQVLSGAISIGSAQSYEEIAGTQTTSTIKCPAGTYLLPPHPAIGKRWRTTCHSSGQKVVFSGDVIGKSSVVIGGRKVPALHTRLTLSFSGSQSGTNPNDYWLSPQNGLILRQRETVDVSQTAGPLGSVRYTEQMAITLTSLVPTR
ncbi:MAG TPA: hypothetical protein VHZ02_13000, partial [Acidimicrobiales bacterium]|nr:hypothetical protein [Acidimicrobiales bacterium]